METEVTILMPCLNEAETLATCVRKALAFLLQHGLLGEVLVADNGSTDGSPDVAASEGARVVRVERRGYGAALMGGIAAAKGKYIIMGDADDSYDFSGLMSFVMRLREGADLVMGNRFKGGIEPGAMPFLHRYLGNPVLSWLGRLFFGVRVRDFHCGLRGFSRNKILDLNLRTTGMEFASEMVVRAAFGELRIEEVPITFRSDGRSRPPHLRTWRDGWRHLKFLLMYSPRWLFMIPGVSFVVLGALLAGLLSFGPLHLQNNVVLDLNSFVAACFMVIVGTQLITFSIIARYYAAVTGFLPDNRRVRALVRHVTTDRLVWLAIAFIIAGIALFGSAISIWTHSGFGPITTPFAPRSAAAGLTAIVIGFQTFFSAFFLGVLTIPLQRPTPVAESEF